MAYGKLKADTLVYDNSGSDVEVTLSSLGNKANSASPTFTGTVTIPTPTAGDNTTKAASTAFVVAGFAPKDAPAFTGTATGANLTLSGTLTVNGTTTTISSTTIEVADKNLELGKVSTPTDTTADGGGITLKGASDKTFNWVDATDAWTSSEHIVTATDKRILIGTTTEGSGGADELTVNTASGHGGMTIRTDSSSNGNIWFSDGTSGAAEYAGYLQYDHSTDALRLGSAGALALTLDSSRNAAFYGTVTDSKGDVRSIPRNNQSSAYTLVASDAGKFIRTTAGVTVPADVLSVSDAVTIWNNSGSDITITQGSSVTIYNSADASTGNRTLAARGLATLLVTGAGNEMVISGAGLS